MTYHKGDWVIAKNLMEGLIIGSAAEQLKSGDESQYLMHVRNSGQVAWVPANDIMRIKPDQMRRLREWDMERANAQPG
jgi:hypothetical protein